MLGPRPFYSMNRFFTILLWLGISALGVLAVLASALQRGEPVPALWLVIAGACSFAVSYRFYSLWLVTKVLVLDDDRAPRAHEAVSCAHPPGRRRAIDGGGPGRGRAGFRSKPRGRTRTETDEILPYSRELRLE